MATQNVALAQLSETMAALPSTLDTCDQVPFWYRTVPPLPLVATQNPVAGQAIVAAAVPRGVTFHFPLVSTAALPEWSMAAQKDLSEQDTAVNAWPTAMAETVLHEVPS